MSDDELVGVNAREKRMANGSRADERNDSRSTEMTSLSENTTARPRSRRVHRFSQPEDLQQSSPATSSIRTPPLSPSCPPIPPRSPLRPSLATAQPPSLPASPHLPDISFELMPLLHSRSLGSLSGLLDQPFSVSRRPSSPDKPLPLTPQPSNSMSLSSVDPEEEDDDETLIPSMSSTSTRTSMTAVLTKREHALQELLTSERSYASDLALIRDIHIPLALGASILTRA